jgi:hypothetical protein
MKIWLLLLGLLLPPLASYANDSVQTPRPPFKNRGTPEEFLRDLYDHYNQGDGNAPDLQRRDAAILADPQLLALIKRDHELVPREVGAYDGDPICSCQDTDGMSVGNIRIVQQNMRSAKAKVSLNFDGDRKYYILDYHLVWSNGAWRIHNIINETNHDDVLKVFKTGVIWEEQHRDLLK